MTAAKRVGLIGGGVIGSGWAARFALAGWTVKLYDPDPEIGRKLDEVLANARRAYGRLTLAPVNEIAPGQVTVVGSIAEAVADADFVQESVGEREDLKRRLMAEADAHAPAGTVIASSTSGLLPTRFSADCARPERILVGHPFNPVYLMPLVELVGGEKTSEETIEAAREVYAGIGMHPLKVRKEIDGFIADRLMESVWREALHLIDEGVATTDEIDQAICYGPGLRWSFMGTFLIYRLAGGEGGMHHFLEQFGPTMDLPWARFRGPELTPDLIDRIARQSDDQAGGTTIRELERLRDDCLVSVLQGLRGRNYAAGAVLKNFEEHLLAESHGKVYAEGDDLSTPLDLHRTRVPADWVDYNGHMTESRYLQAFGDSTDGFLWYVGVNEAYHQAGLSYYTVETHICHIREVAGEEPIAVATQVLGADEKRLHLFHTMRHETDGTVLATAEHMLLHVNTKESRACPARQDVLEKVLKIAEAQAALPKPERSGRAIEMPSPKS